MHHVIQAQTLLSQLLQMTPALLRDRRQLSLGDPVMLGMVVGTAAGNPLLDRGEIGMVAGTSTRGVVS